VDRSDVYVTNVVKHFRFEERAKLRPHKKPTPGQIEACRPWLDAELDDVAPSIIFCLGGSAAQGLLGSRVRLMRDHGVPVDWDGYLVIPTIHPVFVLRSSDSGRRSALLGLLVGDLKKAAELGTPGSSGLGRTSG
jgi:DNA polymerase